MDKMIHKQNENIDNIITLIFVPGIAGDFRNVKHKQNLTWPFLNNRGGGDKKSFSTVNPINIVKLVLLSYPFFPVDHSLTEKQHFTPIIEPN
jgi:hypothetical protein